VGAHRAFGLAIIIAEPSATQRSTFSITCGCLVT
jgi:hypothetical protein